MVAEPGPLEGQPDEAFSRRRLLRSWTILTVGDVAAKAVGITTLVVISRMITVQGFGTYSFAIAFGTSFAFFTDLGLDAATTRELVAAGPDDEGRILGSALLVKSILVIVVGIAAVGTLFLFGSSLRTAAGTAAVAMLASIPGTPALLLNARIRVVGATVIQFLGALATLAGTVAVLASSRSITALVAVASVVTVAAGVGLAVISRRIASAPLEVSSDLARLIVKAAAPIGAALIGVVVYRRADQLLLGAFGRLTDLGQYAAAVRLVDALNILPLGVATLALPVLTRAQSPAADPVAGPDPEDVRLASTGFRLLAAVILPLAAVGTYEGGAVMSFVFGPPFRAAGSSLAVLLWAHYFGFTGTLIDQVLIARRRSRYMAAFTLAGAAINLVANLWVIPAYGKLGAAYTSLVAYAFPAVAGVIFVEVRDVFITCFRHSLRPLVAAGVLLLGLELLRPGPVLGAVLVGIAVTPVLVATGSLRVEEIRDMAGSVAGVLGRRRRTS